MCKIHQISALIFFHVNIIPPCQNFRMLCLTVTRLGSSDSLKKGNSTDVQVIYAALKEEVE